MGWYVPCSALTVYTEHQEGCLACKNLLHASPKFLFWTIWLNLKVVALNSSCRLICVLDAFWAVTWLLMCDCERWQTSGAVKLYLFDVFTKLAIAADSAPDDSLQFHVCSDVIDIAVDVGTICWSVEQNCQHVCWHFLWSPCVIGQMICIFIMSFVLSFFFFFSSPNLSHCRVDVCHTCTHGVALVRI